MAAPMANGTDVWAVVRASPPLRLTIRPALTTTAASMACGSFLVVDSGRELPIRSKRQLERWPLACRPERGEEGRHLGYPDQQPMSCCGG